MTTLDQNQSGTDQGNQPGAEPNNQDGASNQNQQTQNDDGMPPDNPQWDEKTAAHIKKLRAENAKLRTERNKLETDYGDIKSRLNKIAGNEEEEVDPVEYIQQLENHSGQLEYQMGMLHTAYELGIPKDALDYFGYLLSKECENLEDGEELEDEVLHAIAEKAKATSKMAPQAGTFKSSAGSTNPLNQSPNQNDGVSLEQFVQMGMGQKSALYQKNPELYASLSQQARQKKILVKR